MDHLFACQKIPHIKSLTLQSRYRWIVKKWVFGDFHWNSSDRDLWFWRSCQEVNKLIWRKLLTAQSRDGWIVTNSVFWDFHWNSSDRDLWFLRCTTYKEINKLILQKPLTIGSWYWWIVKKWVFWDLHSDCSGLDLLLLCTSKQVIVSTKIIYCRKLRLMDCKDMSPLRPSLRLLRPWSVISLHLETSHRKYKNHLLPKVEIDGL